MTKYSVLGAILSLSLARVVRAWPDLPVCTTPFKPFVYAGCFQDLQNPGSLIFRSNLPSDNMTVELCMQECKGNGYRYAGLEYYGICFCGGTVDGPQIDESKCNYPCNGNNSEVCGGNAILSVYQDPTFENVDDTDLTDYVSAGCWTDDSSLGRALVYKQDQLNSSQMTTDLCLSACKQGGYPFAGTEFSGECWCGMVIGNGTQAAPASDCNMPCNGDNTQTCGGPARLSFYVAKDLESLEPCGYVSSSTTTPTPTPTPSICTATYTVTPTNPACEVKCGSWCSNQLPSWSDKSSCSAAVSFCNNQYSQCVGYSGASACAKYSSWCSQVSSYCSSSCPGNNCNRASCYKSVPPPAVTTSTYTCTATAPPKMTTTTSTPPAATCTSVGLAPQSCEYKCGNWCSTPLPEFTDLTSCKTCAASCVAQTATCFLRAGLLNLLSCFSYGSWCTSVSGYCGSYCPGGDCNKVGCFKQHTPSGYKPTYTTSIYQCTPTPTGKSYWLN